MMLPPSSPWARYAGELEAHFNPRLRIPDAEERLEWRRQASSAARGRIRHDLDLRYGPGPRQVLDLFHPEHAGPSALVFVHGGYWRGGDKAAVSFVAEPFVAQGIPTFVLNYDLCPSVPLSCIVAEIGEALAWIGEHAAELGCSNRLFLFGHSAGAHLCAMVLARLQPGHSVIGAALASGLYDLEPLLQLSINEQLGLGAADVATLSPRLLPAPAEIPLLLSIGGLEAEGWRAQTEHYFAWCREQGARAELHMCDGQDHMSLLDHHVSSPACPVRRRMLEIMTGNCP